MSLLTERARAALEAARAAGLERALPAVSHRRGVSYRLGDRTVVGFCSNDYLGLAGTPVTVTAAPGASASRLVCGDAEVLREAEQRLAAFVGVEEAVLFPSGYQANVGALSALLAPRDRVYSDRLAHASLIDGIRLSKARPTILPHGRPPPPAAAQGALWVTEAVFSMDGDGPNPKAMADFLQSGGTVYLDEAHSAGIFAGGRGWAAAHGLHPEVRVFTLGKAFGHAGAAILTHRPIAQLLRTTARSFVFSTGPSPLSARAILHALDRVAGPEGDERRAALWANVRRLGSHLGEPEPPSPIFPILVGRNDDAVAAARALLERGFHVQPIRPPTVPEGTARLRVTVTAVHTPAQIDALAEVLHDVLRPFAPVPRVTRGHVPSFPP